MGLLSMAIATVKSFTSPPASVLAGGGASIIAFGVGCALVAAGVAFPPIAILGLHIAAAPITMTMVAAFAPAIGHIVTAVVPDTYNQQINQLAAKLETTAEDIKSKLPEVAYSYPGDNNKVATPNNLNK